MSREFKIEKDYWNDNDILFKKSKIKFDPGLTVLVGCNGSGKSTILLHLKSKLENKGIKYISFNNLTDGGDYARSKASFYGDLEFLSTSICSSEGENIIMNLRDIASRIGTISRKYDNIKELWILLDAIDSGLSIDNIIQVKDLFDLVIEDNKQRGTDIYIIASANEYELARGEQCFDVTNCKYITFKDYEDYRNFIIKSAEYKEKRYEND